MASGIISSPSERERRDAERERRIAKGRAIRAAEAAPAQALVAEAGLRGNGGPPELAPAVELRALGELLYGRRWVQELAEEMGEHSRQVRRWMSGEARVDPRALAWARDAARKRATEILRLVGEA